MKYQNVFIQNIFYFLLILAFVGCNNEQPTETNQDYFGLYESSTFIEPGSNDGGVDIQSLGGYLKISLKNNHNFTAELFIPEKALSNYPKGVTNYEGKYLLENNGIQFTSSFIVNKLVWNKSTKQLESSEVPSRGQPFKIVLDKYLN